MIKQVCTWLLAAIASGLCTATQAADVSFDGSILDSCTLALTTSGALALSADGTTLGSEVAGGRAAQITVLSTGSHTVTVGAPTRSSAPPPGYDTATETVEIAYSGETLLAGVRQPYTTSATGFAVGTIALTTLDLNSRITNPAGFASGSYTTRTVVTCN